MCEAYLFVFFNTKKPYAFLRLRILNIFEKKKLKKYEANSEFSEFSELKNEDEKN